MPNQVTPAQPTQDDWQKLDERVRLSRIAVTAQNAFGMNLLRAVVHEKAPKNVFLSPLSVFLALAMTEGGAAGSTRTAMRETLGLPDKDAAILNESIDALQRVLKMPGGTQFLIASAIWVAQGVPISPDFVKNSETVFRATAASLPFKDRSATKHINDWVSENTKGKIPEIVTFEAVRDAVIILTNAVYFAGKWSNTFSKSATQNELFHLTGGTTQMVPMMHQDDLKYAYRSGRDYQGVSLSYQGSSVVFYALLPEKGKTPADVLAHLDLAKLDQSGPYDVDLKLPRFSLDFGSSMTRFLKKLGMEVAFKYPDANFRPMGSELFFISDVIHKTRLEVDEEGTVAAAATAVLMGAGAGRPQPREKKLLVFNRPFVALISDTRTGTLLFAGAIEKP